MTLCLFCSCFLQTWIYPEHILLSKKVLLRLIDIKTIHITLKTVVLVVGCFSVSPDILWFKIKIWLLPSTVNSNKRFTRSCFQGSQVEFSSFLSPRSSIADLGLAFWSYLLIWRPLPNFQQIWHVVVNADQFVIKQVKTCLN